MAVNRYIGMRYVPKIIGAHDPQIAYEALSIVTYNGNSYTSKQNVPPGTEITNTDYWVVTGNYNAQVEQYRSEVVNAVATVTESMSDLESSVNETVEQLEASVDESIDEMESNVTTVMDNTIARVNVAIGAQNEHVNGQIADLRTNVNTSLATTTAEIEGYVDDRVETALPNVLLLDAGGGDISGRSTLKTCIATPTITIINNSDQQRAFATVNIPQEEVSGHLYFLRSASINWESATAGQPTIGPKGFVPISSTFVTINGTRFLQVVLDAIKFATETTNISYKACVDYIDVSPNH